MKDIYAKYGEVIYVDSTYRINRDHYPCYVFVVRDNHGHSQIVAAAITAYEREASFSAIVSHFVASNDISRTKALMIDKDLIESKVLKVFIALILMIRHQIISFRVCFIGTLSGRSHFLLPLARGQDLPTKRAQQGGIRSAARHDA